MAQWVKNLTAGSSGCGAVETNLTSIQEDAGSIPGLRSVCQGCRVAVAAAIALIGPLAWQPPMCLR